MKGKLIDMVTGEPIPFAYVTTKRDGHQFGTQSDELGLWSFEFLPGEALTFDVLSYSKAYGVADPSTFLISQMQPKATDLGDVVVYPNERPKFPWLLVALGLLVYSQRKRR